MELIHQETVYSFDNWFSNKLKNIKYSSKLGEATFSEVFKFEMRNGENEVVKIIPLDLGTEEIEDDVYPLPININAAIHECTVLNEISSLKEHRKNSSPPHFTGFNNNIEMCVIKGQYPKALIRNWNKWNKDKVSENSNPGRYNSDQHYLIISMEDGGVDLEHYTFKNMKEIESVLIQIIHALAFAEEKIQFEHRDLHLGNILVKSTSVEKFYHHNDSFEFNGIKCSIIDYSLSRMSDSAGVAFRDLDTIEWLFEGDPKIDSQYQVYKDMRQSKGQISWQNFHPRTNILWLHFIFERLVQKQKKYIQKPKNIFLALTKLHKNILKYYSVQELKQRDEFFNK